MAISVGGSIPNPQINTTQTTTTGEIQGRDITGAGVTGQAGQVPNSPTDPSYGAVLESLAALMPQITGQMLDVLLLEITVKMKEIEESAQKDKIKVDNEAKRSALSEKQEKLAEAEKKIQEAIDKEKNASIWDKIKIAFQAIGAALAIALGAILIATGVGAVAGGLLIAAGIVGIISTIDAIVKETTGGFGIMGNIIKAATGDEDAARIGDMAFGATLAVAGIALAVATFFAPSGAINAVQSMINLAKTAQQVGSIVNGIMTATTATGDITAGAIRFEAAKSSADATKLQAEGKVKEAFIQQLDDFIDQALQRLMGASERFNAMLDGLMDAIQTQAASTAKAKFTG